MIPSISTCSDVLEISYPSLGFGGAIAKFRTNIKYTAPIIHPKYTKNTKANNIGLIHCGFECEDISGKNRTGVQRLEKILEWYKSRFVLIQGKINVGEL